MPGLHKAIASSFSLAPGPVMASRVPRLQACTSPPGDSHCVNVVRCVPPSSAVSLPQPSSDKHGSEILMLAFTREQDTGV